MGEFFDMELIGKEPCTLKKKKKVESVPSRKVTFPSPLTHLMEQSVHKPMRGLAYPPKMTKNTLLKISVALLHSSSVLVIIHVLSTLTLEGRE